jgi:hypothetical protein
VIALPTFGVATIYSASKTNTEKYSAQTWKKLLSYFFLLSIKDTHSLKSMFSKDPIINLENFQKQQIYYGIFRV